MARPVDDIFNSIMSGISTNENLNGSSGSSGNNPLVSSSMFAYYRNLAYVIAVAQNYDDQLRDAAVAQIEAFIFPPGNTLWYQQQVLLFQYGDILQLNAFYIPEYPIIDPTARIISNCTVDEQPNSSLLIKVCKSIGGVKTPLLSIEKSALASYLDKLKFAGTGIQVISQDSDRLYIAGNIYYNGEIGETTMRANVRTAIQAFCDNLQFDGSILLSKIENSFEQCPGMIDYSFTSVKARSSSVTITSSDAQEITRIYNTISGTVVLEDTSGFTIDDTLQYIAQ